jgi:hypothetical protein
LSSASQQILAILNDNISPLSNPYDSSAGFHNGKLNEQNKEMTWHIHFIYFLFSDTVFTLESLDLVLDPESRVPDSLPESVFAAVPLTTVPLAAPLPVPDDAPVTEPVTALRKTVLTRKNPKSLKRSYFLQKLKNAQYEAKAQRALFIAQKRNLNLDYKIKKKQLELLNKT